MKNKDSSQKIMYLNPVGFDAYDAFFAEMIKKHKFSNSEIHVASLSSSVGQMDNLEYRTYNALIASDLIKATRQWSAQPPPENDISRFGLFKDDYHFGNRIIVK